MNRGSAVIMMKRKINLTIAFMPFLLLLGACGNKKETAEIAVIPDAPPFMYEEDGDLTGFEVELVNAIAEEEDLDIDWQKMEFDSMIPGLQANQLDGAIAGILVTDERKEVIDYSDVYFEQGMTLVVPPDSTIDSLEDVKDKTIVAKQGDAGLDAAKKIAEDYDAKEVKELDSQAAIYLELEKGDVDALVDDEAAIKFKIKEEE